MVRCWRFRVMLAFVPVLVGGAALGSGCSQACTDESNFGLVITVLDARSGAPVCDGTVVAIEGSYREELENLPFVPCHYYGAKERAGTYRLEFARQGYASKQVEGLTVSSGECHIAAPVVLTVSVVPDTNVPPDSGGATD
jgi:hypothetical protein